MAEGGVSPQHEELYWWVPALGRCSTKSGQFGLLCNIWFDFLTEFPVLIYILVRFQRNLFTLINRAAFDWEIEQFPSFGGGIWDAKLL